jgi:hypothetical protein
MASWSIPSAEGSWGSRMKIYSIVKIGDEFVVQAGDESVLRITSRRKAVQLVTEATELLSLETVPQLSEQASIAPLSPETSGVARDRVPESQDHT